MLDPIEYLQERLDEINSIKCTDVEFLRYKTKFKVCIDFLKLTNFVKKDPSLKNVDFYDRMYIRQKYKELKTEELSRIFNLSHRTIKKIAMEKTPLNIFEIIN